VRRASAAPDAVAAQAGERGAASRSCRCSSSSSCWPRWAHISQRQQLGSASEIEAARAFQSASSGLEWGSFQVLRNPAPPAAAPACFSNTSFNPPGSLAGFTVTVTCARTPASGTVSDGATALAFYELVANACNAPSGGACPASGTPQPTYVERQLKRTVVR
jgi:MSHA biogenesis protein MshP